MSRIAVDALSRIAVKLEHAKKVKQEPVVIAAIDLAKAFDNIPIELAMATARKVGLDPDILRPVEAVYAQMVKHFKIGTGVGEGWKATNGVMQGCPVSCLFMNVMMMVGIKVMREMAPNLDIITYVDDVTLLGSAADIQLALTGFLEFLADTAQEMSMDKTKVSYPNEDTPRVTVGGHTFPHENLLRILGVDIGYVEDKVAVRLREDKLDDAVEACRRITTSEIGFDARAKVLAGAVVPRALFGCEVADMEPAKENGLRAALVTAQWMKPGRRRSSGLILTLLTPGHRIDPTQVCLARRLVAMARAVSSSANVKRMVGEIIVADGRGARGEGPVSTLLAGQRRFHYRLGDILATPPGGVGHLARFFARKAIWRQVSEQRRGHDDVGGILGGIDRERTAKLLQSRALTETRRGALRFLLAGAFWQPSSACSRCGGDGGVRHALWECPRFAEIRQHWGLTQDLLVRLPRLTATLGVATADLDSDIDVEKLQHGFIEIFRLVLRDSGVDLHA